MNNNTIRNIIRLLVLLAVILVILPFWVFVINERELAVVLQFGKPVREYVDPGVHFKIPFMETVRRLPKTYQFWSGQYDSIPDLPTKDDKKIEVIPWAIWRISEPITFVQQLRNEGVAEDRVRQITRSAIRDVISQYDLAELVRSTDRRIPKSSDFTTPPTTNSRQTLGGIGDGDLELGNAVAIENAGDKEIQFGRPHILQEIKSKAQARLRQHSAKENSVGRGIELIDVGISQIDFVSSVQTKTFDRWVAERRAISAANVNEGERLKQAIINKARADVERIEGEGQQKASEIIGRADAAVISLYADALNRVGEFYTFSKTLEVYKAAINKDSTLILSTDSDLLRLLKKQTPASKPQR